MLGIIGAMEEEVNEILALMKIVNERFKNVIIIFMKAS